MSDFQSNGLVHPVSGLMLTLDSDSDAQVVEHLIRQGVTLTRVTSQDMVRAVRSAESTTQKYQPFPHTHHVAVALDLKQESYPLTTESDKVPDLILTSSLTGSHLMLRQAPHHVLVIFKIRDNETQSVGPDIFSEVDGVCITLTGSEMSDATEQLVSQCRQHGKAVIWAIDPNSGPLAEGLYEQLADCLMFHHSDLCSGHQIIQRQVESQAQRRSLSAGTTITSDEEVEDMILLAAVNVSRNRKSVKAIVVLTTSGQTVRQLVNGMTCPCPVVAVVNNKRLARQMRVLRHVIPFLWDGDLSTSDWRMTGDKKVTAVSHFLSHLKVLSPGVDEIVLIVESELSPTGAPITCTLPAI